MLDRPRSLLRPLLLAGLALVAVLSLLPAAVPTAGAAGDARIRAVHAVPDFGAVDVYVDGARALSNVTFFSVSDYLTVPAGHRRVQVIPAGEDLRNPSIEVVDTGADLVAGRDYSFVVRGSVAGGGIGGSLRGDDNTAPAAGKARLRAAHFSPDAPAVDVLIDGQRAVRNLAYRNLSGYLEVDPGTYTVAIAPAGGSPIFTTSVTLAADTVYTAWANGLLGGSGEQAFALTPSVDAAFGIARVRAVHAVPDIAGSPVDVYANGTKIVTFDFFDATDYLPLREGRYDIRVVLAGGDPATEAVIQADVEVAAGQFYSIVARGTGGNFGATVLEDDNSRPEAGNARLRVAHFSPDAPAVDIFINGARSAVQGLEFRSATGYLSVPAGSYEVGVAPAGGTPIYTTSVTLEAGTVYTAWANGLLGGADAQAFKVTPTVDAVFPSGLVRLLHAVPNAPAVDIFVGGQRAAANVSFGEITGFLPLYAGDYAVEVRPAGTSTVAISGTITVEGGRAYTAAAVGLLGGTPAAGLALFEENQTRPAAGRSGLQVVHLSPDAPAVDVLSGSETLVDGLRFGEAERAEVAAGTRTLRVALDAGGAEVLSGAFTLPSGDNTTLFVIGLAGAGDAEEPLRIITARSTGGAPAATFRVNLPLIRR